MVTGTFSQDRRPVSPAAIRKIEQLLRNELSVCAQLETLSEELLDLRGRTAEGADGHEQVRRKLEAVDALQRQLQQEREATLADLQVLTGEPVRLGRLIARLPEGETAVIQQLRQELLGKMIRIRSMNLAGQMSIVYRLEHYRQLVQAWTGSVPGQDLYLPTGRMEGLPTQPHTIQDC